jgi:major membrane immunogen (membrane-anchored lipoprotein)
MDYKSALRQINKLLGTYKFNSYKVAETGQELICEGELQVGEPIFIITNNGQLPAANGEYELEDTTKIKVEDGKVQEIKYDMEKTEKEKFVEATLKDGTVLKSPTFDVGENVFVVGADGSETPAPDGEHEITLRDSEDNEVVMKIITKDGKITERENVELSYDKDKKDEEMGMTPDLSIVDGMIDEDFKKTVMSILEEIKEAIKGVMEDQEEMKVKMSKFSKEPAGEPIKQSKNLVSDAFAASRNDAFSKLLKTRHNL